MTGRRLALVLAAVLVPASASGQAADASGHLRRARACHAALDYECAEAELALARRDLPDLEPATRLAVLRLSAETALATGRTEDAAAHLESLLRQEPDFAPEPGAWPSGWQARLEAVRATLPDVQAPVLDVEPPAEARAGTPLPIRVRVADRSGVGPVVLGVGGTVPTRIPMTTTDGQAWTATVPAGQVVAPTLRLWVEAADLKGNGPARWGSEAAPREMPVAPAPPPPPPPLVKRWWFWTVIGLAAAGTGVGIYFLSRLDSGSGDAGLSGRGRLGVEVRWPSPSD